MDILWPGFLLLLLLIPALIAVYIWRLRRRRRAALHFSSLSLVRDALPRRSGWRRHVPFALFLLAIASLTIALVRPVTIASLPAAQTTIILSMDVSMSMRFRDIPPSRLEAAEAAALNFIRNQKANTQIGIVAFSGSAELIQPPTTDANSLEISVDSLTTGRRTAIGSGILGAIDAIAQVDPNVTRANWDETTPDPAVPVPQGAYAPEIVVLLTDGVSNAGITPVEAAQQAATRGVRVYTIGFGTDQGPSNFDFGQGQGQGQDPRQNGGGQQGQGGFNFFGGGGGLGGFRRGIDEATLKKVADLTGGTYYPAASAGELQSVFEKLPTNLITRHEVTEITVIFAALGAFLACAALVLAQVFHPLP
jgi:Ca-activated chloride channel homolog